jgi:hypothetical protein
MSDADNSGKTVTKFSVTKNGKALNKSKYTWNEKTKTFSTTEYNLVIDFTGVNNVTFRTGSYCVFKTGDNCTFDTGNNCTFKTGSDCTFKTGVRCTFNTGALCTFDTGYSCTFNTGENCVAIRYDVKGIIKIPEGKTIKFNTTEVSGYKVIEKHIITIDGKEIELSEESYQNLKKQLT